MPYFSQDLRTSVGKTMKWLCAPAKVNPISPTGAIYRHVDPCLYTAGDIHIWDRDSATLLRHIPPQTVDGDLTCLAWNTATGPLMFATGSHHGVVRVWTPIGHPPQSFPLYIPEHGSYPPGGASRTSQPSSPYSPGNENGFESTRIESARVSSIAG